ncbi:MAG: branched-chain amino acid transporter permease [Firmicutes bacterium]|nr:branched-chain amino acid transporter permease [Bacillota bacterium]
MTVREQLITVAILVAATMLTRFLPFAVFSSGKPAPRIVMYLGRVLPPAIFSMLVVYCLRSVDLMSDSHGLPELIAVLVTAGVHLWRRQTLLSIVAGTACYMILLQFVFA